MSNIDNLEYHPIPGLEQLPECDDNEKTGEPIDLYGIDACREHDESI
ncbi:hypothetical protein SIPHO019v1_70001, partial [Vibrio phage 82E32.1]